MGTFSPRQRYRILRRDGFTCQYCGKTPDDGAKLEIDHIVPAALGGTNDEDNLQVACFDCNRGKVATEILSYQQANNKIEPPLNTVTRPREKLILKCKRTDCQRSWEYTGTKKYPAQVNCPCCGNKLRLPKEE